ALQGQAQGGDLVQKQRPRMGEFDVSGPRRSRVRECTLLVPEQLGLDQVLGQGCTIDTYERLFGARTEGNDRSRYQLLACTALAPDENSAVAIGQSPDSLIDSLHGLA